MSKLTDADRERIRRELATAEQEMAGMTGAEKRDYMIANGYATEMSDEDVERDYGGYGHTRIVFIGEAKPRLQAGSIVMVQQPSGAWENRMMAVQVADGIVYVAGEDEVERAQAEGRTPRTVAYPAQRVKLAAD